MLTLETRKSVPKGKLRGNRVKSFHQTGGLHATFYWKWTLLVSRLVHLATQWQKYLKFCSFYFWHTPRSLSKSCDSYWTRTTKFGLASLKQIRKIDTFSLLAAPLGCTVIEIPQSLFIRNCHTPRGVKKLTALEILLKASKYSSSRRNDPTTFFCHNLKWIQLVQTVFFNCIILP